MRVDHTLVWVGVCSFAVLCGCDGGSSPTTSTASRPKPAPKAAPAEKPAPTAETPAEPVAEMKEGWGHLKGRFVYDGAAPTQAPLSITKDQEFCGQHQIVDESLVVAKEGGGLANVVVHLYVKRGQTAPDPHESYAEAEATQVALDNNKCRFEPHVTLLRTSQPLLIKNSDPVGHNTNISTLNNTAFNQTIPTGSELEHRFAAAERRPAMVTCNIHPWMKGWVLPQETPYFTVSNTAGEFEIQNLPSGTWTFQVWHEKAGGVSEVTIDGKATKWSKGRVEVTISADATTDLGEIKLGEGLFKE